MNTQYKADRTSKFDILLAHAQRDGNARNKCDQLLVRGNANTKIAFSMIPGRLQSPEDLSE